MLGMIARRLRFGTETRVGHTVNQDDVRHRAGATNPKHTIEDTMDLSPLPIPLPRRVHRFRVCKSEVRIFDWGRGLLAGLSAGGIVEAMSEATLKAEE